MRRAPIARSSTDRMRPRPDLRHVRCRAVTVILTVDTATWRARLNGFVGDHAAGDIDMLPVVKGNGYGFGRERLTAEVDRLGLSALAVGTVFELTGPVDGRRGDGRRGGGRRRIVLTPIVSATEVAVLADVPDAVPTVGSRHHVQVLGDAGWRGPVVIKLASSMRRYGVGPDELGALVEAAATAGLTIHAYALHLPLNDHSASNDDEAVRWLGSLPDDGVALHLSHLSVDELRALAGAAPARRLVHRVGTALWHGTAKDGLHLAADVLDVRAVRTGDTAGYRGATVPGDGQLVMVGAGTAHGVHPLADGLSPFHFARHRLELLEPPHMHTSMVLMPAGDPCPAPGDLVDLQHPLTRTLVDRVVG